MKRRLASLLSVIALASGFPVAAQDFSGVSSQYIDFGSSMTAVGQLNNVLGSTIRSGGRGGPRTGVGGRAATSPPVRPVDTRYRASPAVTTRVKGQFADFVAKTDPANAVRLRQAVQQKDLLGAWEKHVSADGLRRGDVSDAMAAYWVQNWQIANNVAFADRNQVQAVRGQVNRALGSSPAFTRLDDAGKQEIAETFMYNFVAQGSAFADATARGDRKTSSRLSDAAASRFRDEVGVDLRQLRLTNQGMIKR